LGRSKAVLFRAPHANVMHHIDMSYEEIKKRFENRFYHDVEIQDITIPRDDPGNYDSVLIALVDENNHRFRIDFKKCYKAQFNMNFGIICSETIRSASCKRSTPMLEELRKSWKKVGVNLVQVISFEIETNSTGSILTILAEDIEVTKSNA
jgi:hypothetical protein